MYNTNIQSTCICKPIIHISLIDISYSQLSLVIFLQKIKRLTVMTINSHFELTGWVRKNQIWHRLIAVHVKGKSI